MESLNCTNWNPQRSVRTSNTTGFTFFLSVHECASGSTPEEGTPRTGIDGLSAAETQIQPLDFNAGF